MLLGLGACWALAEDSKARAAREELERELAGLTAPVPTRVRVEYGEIDDPNYALQLAEFALDGRALPTPPPGALTLSAEARTLVWEGDVPPGRHVLTAKLRYRHTGSPLLVEEGGHEWVLSAVRSFEQQRGIEVRVLVQPVIDRAATSVEKRLTLSLPATPVMLAKLDDGSMPALKLKPTSDEAETVTVDAGAPPRVEATPPPEPPAEAAPARVRSRPPEPNRKVEPALQHVAETTDDDAADAGAPALEPPDAGLAVPAAPTQEMIEEGTPASPWWLVGVAGVGLVLLLVVIARRRARPPRLD